VRRTATSRLSEDLLREDDLYSSERLLAGAQAATVLLVDRGGTESNRFSTCEELAARSAITLVDGKWRVSILRLLQNGPVHLGELKRRLSPVSKKVLNQHLRQMAKDGLVIRTEFAGNVPRVEYSLVNPLGYAVLELLKAIAEWGGKHRQSIEDREVSLPNVTALSSNHCPNSDRHPREITHISRSTT
jgi:DNA-binding HxlR family transcriptional regulator